jgi:CubicO group peptidase (beta-lactamase class C family)
LFWVDPVEKMVVVMMAAAPGELRKIYREKMSAVIYGALREINFVCLDNGPRAFSLSNEPIDKKCSHCSSFQLRRLGNSTCGLSIKNLSNYRNSANSGF